MNKALLPALLVSRRLLTLTGKAEVLCAGAILLAIVLMILVQVALNAGLGNPIPWEQEGGAYLLVWLTFLGASIALKQMRHVKIASFVSVLPPRAEAVLRMLAFAVIIWLLYVLMRELLGSNGIIAIEGRASTVALPIDVPRSWFFSVPLFVSCILMLWTTTHYFLENLLRLLTPAATSPVSPLLE